MTKLLTKAEIAALERIWIREISGTLPLQSKAKIYDSLKEQGLVGTDTRVFGADRFGQIKVEGWSLTHAGRFAYCATCTEVDENDG